MADKNQNPLDAYIPKKASANPLDVYLKKDDEPGLASRAMSAVATGAGNAVQGVVTALDYLTGAAPRAAAEQIIEGKGPVEAAKAFGRQYTKGPSTAPSPEKLAEKLGYDESPLVPKLAEKGFGKSKIADLARTRFNAGGLIANLFAKPSKDAASEVLGDTLNLTNLAPAMGVIKKAIPAESSFGRGLTRMGEGLKDFAATAVARGGSNLTGLPEATIKNYMVRGRQAKNVITEHGGDIEGSAVQAFQNDILKKLRDRKSSAYSEIQGALKNAPKDRVIDMTPVVRSLEESAAALHPVKDAGQIRELQNLIGKIRQITEPAADELLSRSGGYAASVQDAQAIKQLVGDIAAPAYLESGQVIRSSPAAQNAAVRARKVAKEIIDVKGPKELKEANGLLERLHNLEDSMNPALVNAEKAPGAVFAAGAGTNRRTSQQLEEIGALLGEDVKQQALDLATARDFKSSPWFAVDPTGKSTTRHAVPAGIGSAVGYSVAGAPGAFIGGALGGALASPTTLKHAIDAGRVPTEILNRFVSGNAKLSDQALFALHKAMTSEQGQKIINEMAGGEDAIARRATQVQSKKK